MFESLFNKAAGLWSNTLKQFVRNSRTPLVATSVLKRDTSRGHICFLAFAYLPISMVTLC